MIIYIRKRYWYYHENSESVYTDTREGYKSSGYEFTFIHELGPVVKGTKVEGQLLLIEYEELNKQRWYYNITKRTHYRSSRWVVSFFEEKDVEEIGEVIDGTEEEFARLFDKWLPF